MKDFLPISRNDMQQRGWEQCDFVLISGDAYVDHPSFGVAIIGRVLEAEGYKVGIIPQPNWQSDDDFARLGEPRLGFLVAAGNLDSMLNNYTASKKRRSTDEYSAGGRGGKRPNRATIVYCQRIRQRFGNIPIIIGGIEASLRRLAHYDYWDDAVRRPIGVDAQADLLVYGMGELQIREIAHALDDGIPVEAITEIKGVAYLTNEPPSAGPDTIYLPSFEETVASKEKYAEAFRVAYDEHDPVRGKRLVQKVGSSYVIVNPPARTLTTEEMDAVYALPYVRDYHPIYEPDGGVPAIKEVEFSVVSHRGCFGACSFCAITSHQGRIIQNRSEDSIIGEVETLTKQPRFKGYIHDIGGPTANFRNPACEFQAVRGACKGKQCMYPEPCRHLKADHEDYIRILRRARAVKGVKRVFIRSGVRYDYLLHDKSHDFLNELCEHHISGQLKVAPEHVAPCVTNLMGKPGRGIYERFMGAYSQANENLGKKQYLVPYFIASHPGSGLKEAVELAEFVRDMGYHPEQVQDFIPTPGSLSTAMYYTGLNPLTGEKVTVIKSPEKRKLQRALLQYRDPKNWPWVYKALVEAGREDLIGHGPKSLIPPPPWKGIPNPPGVAEKEQVVASKGSTRAGRGEGVPPKYSQRRQGGASGPARGSVGRNQAAAKARATDGKRTARRPK